MKKKGDPDATKEEAKELFEEWKQLGKPKPDGKGKQRGILADNVSAGHIGINLSPRDLSHPYPALIPLCDRHPPSRARAGLS